MNLILGSAVQIDCEIGTDQVSGTVIVLASLKDSDGTELASSESLAFGTGDDANIASVVWQSTVSNLAGKYTFILKATNGARESFAKGSFYLEAQSE